MSHQEAMSRMGEALDYLCKISPSTDNRIDFEITHYGKSAVRLPLFHASTHDVGYSSGKTPMRAVKNLLRVKGVTTVEQYIRLKAAK